MTDQNPPFRFIGQPLPRNEDARLLTGRGQFTDDFSFPGQAYAAMVRSPYAHARIVGIDHSTARTMPGVLGVFTGVDCVADSLGAIPHDPLPKTKFDMKLQGPGGSEIFIGPHLLLPHDKARHVGEAVAMVVAETQAQALDAAEAVTIEYEELPCVIHSEDAMKPGTPAVWDQVRDNILVDSRFGNAAETDRILANAPHVVSMAFHIDRVTGAPMEPRVTVAKYDKDHDRYTIHAGSGGAVRQKR
ncbi:MAG: molybdopterin cofactor-binding domain-containing protein, partial [Pseudolabrys sp.]